MYKSIAAVFAVMWLFSAIYSNNDNHMLAAIIYSAALLVMLDRK